MPVSRTRIVLVSERVKVPRVGGLPHPQLRGLLARGYAGFTEPAAPPHDLVSPATAVVGIVLKLDDSAWRAPRNSSSAPTTSRPAGVSGGQSLRTCRGPLSAGRAAKRHAADLRRTT
jgi:hypothetical protein